MNTIHGDPAMPPQPSGRALAGVLLDEEDLSVEDFARACRVPPGWVVERIEAGLLEASDAAGQRRWRFSSATLVRARRMAQFEQGFDANPELAALAADLVEEVARLRARLKAAGLPS